VITIQITLTLIGTQVNIFIAKARNYIVLLLKSHGTTKLMMGGTLIRQHNFIFDIEANKLGIAHATCSDDPN
jgi:hypothetical protein